MSSVESGVGIVVLPAPGVPTVALEAPFSPSLLVVPVLGPTGPMGPQGANGQTEYHGDGPPPVTILGSHPGDIYINDLNGDRYIQT